MQLSSTGSASIRKFGVHSFIVLVVLGFAFFPSLFSVFKSGSERITIRTEAMVLDVAPAPPARDGTRRLLVEFEYAADNGRRYVRRRRVRTKRDVSIGQRITVSYRKHRPRYGRVVSLSPPPPAKVVSPQSPPNGAWLGGLQWLIGAIALPMIGYGLYLFLTGGSATQNSPTRPAAGTSRARQERRQPSERSQPIRHERPRKRVDPKLAFPPKHKSKVVRRASWF